MSTLFKTQAIVEATGLDQTFTYTEGDEGIQLNPITFVTQSYSSIITLTLSVVGDDVDQIDIKSNSTDAPVVKQDANTWTISSNRHSQVSNTISSLYIELLNSDVDSNFTITTTLDNETSNVQGLIEITGISVPDAINIVQTNNYNEDRYGWSFDVDGLGAPQIQDQLGPDSGRTYRVTLAPRTGADEQYRAFVIDNSGDFLYYNAVVTLEGSQEEINSILRRDEPAAFHIDFGPDWDQDVIIDYTQEVIGGAPNVPYVQERGEFTFIAIPEIQYVVNSPSYTYDEDTILTISNPVTITDSRHLGDGSLLYQTSFKLSDPLAGTLNYGTFDNVDTYHFQGTFEETSAALANIEFVPSADYASDFNLLYSQSRQSQKGNQDWNPAFLSIHATDVPIAMNIGITHEECEIVDVIEYDEDKILTFYLGKITDKRPDNIDPNIQYEIILNLFDKNSGIIEDWDIGEFDNYVFTGTKAECNDKLANIKFLPSADYKVDIGAQYYQTQKTDNLPLISKDWTLKIRNTDVDDGYTVNAGPYTWTQNSNTTLSNFATITDSRGNGEFPDVVYRVYLTMDGSATNANGEFRSFGSGGQSVWDPTGGSFASGELSITGTKDEVNSHLSAIEWWSRGIIDGFTFTTSAFRGNSQDPTLTPIGTGVTTVTMNEGIILPSPANTNIARIYNEDTKTNFNDDSKLFTKPTMLGVTSSTVTAGVFTPWSICAPGGGIQNTDNPTQRLQVNCFFGGGTGTIAINITQNTPIETAFFNASGNHLFLIGTAEQINNYIVLNGDSLMEFNPTDSTVWDMNISLVDADTQENYYQDTTKTTTS